MEYSRIEAATVLFHKIKNWLVDSIKKAKGDVVKATKIIATELGMKNDFPVFMAVMDLAWFRPDLVDPASKVPTGNSSAHSSEIKGLLKNSIFFFILSSNYFNYRNRSCGIFGSLRKTSWFR